MAFFSCLVIVFVVIPTVLLHRTLSVVVNRIKIIYGKSKNG